MADPRTKPGQNDPEQPRPRLEEIQNRLDRLSEQVRELRDKINREGKRERYPIPFGERSTSDHRSRKPTAH